MKFISQISFLLFCFISSLVIAQENQPEKIKIEREETFLKAEFDDVNYKVIALDKYGNPYEEAIKSFVITFQDSKGHFRSEVVGNTFPKKTINYLTKGRDKATNICLRDIVAEDKEGHTQKLPDHCGVLIYPDCKNCDTNKKKKK